jgi:hypothetical protein
MRPELCNRNARRYNESAQLYWRKVEEMGRALVARTARNSSLETRTARVRLRIRRTPYFAKIAKGLRLTMLKAALNQQASPRVKGEAPPM